MQLAVSPGTTEELRTRLRQRWHMGAMMLVMVIVVLGAVWGIGLLSSAFPRREVPPASSTPRDRRLEEQAERIELLEEELRRVKDQADFTEKLLTDRSDEPGDKLLGS